MTYSIISVAKQLYVHYSRSGRAYIGDKQSISS